MTTKTTFQYTWFNVYKIFLVSYALTRLIFSSFLFYIAWKSSMFYKFLKEWNHIQHMHEGGAGDDTNTSRVLLGALALGVIMMMLMTGGTLYIANNGSACQGMQNMGSFIADSKTFCLMFRLLTICVILSHGSEVFVHVFFFSCAFLVRKEFKTFQREFSIKVKEEMYRQGDNLERGRKQFQKVLNFMGLADSIFSNFLGIYIVHSFLLICVMGYNSISPTLNMSPLLYMLQSMFKLATILVPASMVNSAVSIFTFPEKAAILGSSKYCAVFFSEDLSKMVSPSIHKT